MNENITNHEYDVIVIGAGGAGLRAAIEAARSGAKTAIITKSLLGKAHTVMAEGGCAAALTNADPRDGWKVHFHDTMKGSKWLANWRMAEYHAKEAPDRVRELEQWGAVFDRTPKNLINQRNFGGHTFPRLAHVGDATGLEIIRTLQERGIHEGIDIFMEYTVRTLLKEGDRVTGCVAYTRVDRRHHSMLVGLLGLVGIHRRRTRLGPVGWCRTTRHGVRAVPPDRYGLASLCAGHSRHGRRSRRRWTVDQQRRDPLHV